MLLSSRTRRLFVSTGILFLLLVAGGCKGFFVNPTVASVSVSPATNTLAAGSTRQLTATATNSDGSTKDVTGLAVWESSDTAQTFVTVSPTGFVKAVQNTSSAVTITATYKGFSGTATVTVGQPITITCGSCSGNSISMATNGGSGSSVTLSSSAPANWTSSNSNIISVTGSNTTSPTATMGGSTGTVTITVSGTSGGSGSLQITVTQ